MRPLLLLHHHPPPTRRHCRESGLAAAAVDGRWRRWRSLLAIDGVAATWGKPEAAVEGRRDLLRRLLVGKGGQASQLAEEHKDSISLPRQRF